MAAKIDLWRNWIKKTLLSDIYSSENPDPVPIIDETSDELETAEEFDNYRYGRGNGQYLYLLYLLDKPVDSADDVIPVYVGETNKITSRLYEHFRKLRDSLPIEEWEDDGSWGSWSKYDHIAAVYDQADSDLYVWILDVDELDVCPYGFPTYRQELEAKIVGLLHSQPRFERVFANREFVPNRVIHEMGKQGPDWISSDKDNYNPTTLCHPNEVQLSEKSKTDLWNKWIEKTILKDIYSSSTSDPIPLFETDSDLQIQLTEKDKLKRSSTIDERIRNEGEKCVYEKGVRENTPDGLLYVLYQLDSGAKEVGATDITPRYIGKAEAYGKKNELSANFKEIAKNRSATRSFARWGYGDYWHTGELSNTVFGDGKKKLAWADELFEQESQTLKQQTHLWIGAWNPDKYRGPYGYDGYLAEVEPLLIGLAYDAYPDKLLNYDGVPDDAPVKTRDHKFNPVSISNTSD